MVKINKKYFDIITTAHDLFYKHGYKKVTIEEICQKANVSKMTFYKYFPNKIEIAKTIFDELVNKGEKRFKEIMSSDATQAEKMRQVLLMKFESTNDISPEFMQDFYMDSESEVKKFVDERTRKAWVKIINDYKEAQARGIFRKDFNPELFFKIQQHLITLFNDESVTSMFNSQQELIMELANLFVYGIIPHEEL